MRMEGNHILPIIMTMGWCENIPQGFLASKKYIRTFHILYRMMLHITLFLDGKL